MLSRIVSALILSTAIVAILLYTPAWVLGLVVLLALFLCAGEYQKMARPDASGFERGAFIVACLAVVCWPAVAKYGTPVYTHGVAFLAAFMVLAFSRLARPLPLDKALNKFGLDAAGLLYIGATFPFVFLLRDRPDGGWTLVMVMGITFLSDTGGYFAGRFLGKHKLYPTVSPKKTIEGLLGGLALAVVAAFVARHFFPGHGYLTPVDCIVLGVVGALFAVTGDLFESLIKRSTGVKDSGNLIPGHGGMLDRIDGLLFCGPFCWFYLELIAVG